MTWYRGTMNSRDEDMGRDTIEHVYLLNIMSQLGLLHCYRRFVNVICGFL